MPIHEYKCECGKVIEKIVKHSERDNPQICECGKEAKRVPISLSSFDLKGKWFKNSGEY